MVKVEQIKLPVFEDERGIFQKLFTNSLPALRGFEVKQANRVITLEKGVLRGLHYQSEEWGESKLFSVIFGKIQLVTLCIDKEQENYSRCEDYILTPVDNSILIPKGYATGYLVMEDNTEVIYFSDNEYRPEAERGVLWHDPSVDIQWKLLKPKVSEKDKNWPRFEIT